MDTNKELTHKFHQNLGKLFYAVAAIDNNVRNEELDKLIEIVKKEWVTNIFVGTELKMSTEYSIINTFKWLHSDNEYNAETCYESFIAFKKENEWLFTKDMNTLILKTASAIAASFSNINKSELMLLAKLSMDLKKIKNED